ncbi:MAG: toll/interleukin-1 receptor domain-containing protein [Anaerolineae bacterium]|nr:toll/interleukin-1 receptor domain-containing protein [Anaerolineae bacterium]
MPNPRAMPHDIFLSYSRADEPTMRQIYDHLTKTGFSVWIDQTGIPPGTPSWKRAIESAIDDTRCMVVIFSPDAKQSDWVRAEMDYASAQGKPIYPILARGDATNAVPFGHTTAQWVDIRNKPDISAEMSKLAAQIGVTIGVPVKPITPPSAASRPSPSSAVGTGYIPSLPNPAPPAVPAINPLRPWNPINQLRLLWWLFMQPGRFVEYREQVGEKAARTATNWLASTLIWLPVIIPTIASVREPFGEPSSIANTIIALGLVCLAWLSTGWFGRLEVHGVLGGLAGPVAFVVVAIVDILGWVNVWGGLVLGVAYGIAYSIVIVIVFDMSGIITLSTLVGVLLQMLFFQSSGAVGLVVAGVVIGTMGFVTTITVRKSLITHRAVIFTKLLLILLILSYLALIWIYWFGGWRVLP